MTPMPGKEFTPKQLDELYDDIKAKKGEKHDGPEDGEADGSDKPPAKPKQ